MVKIKVTVNILLNLLEELPETVQSFANGIFESNLSDRQLYNE